MLFWRSKFRKVTEQADAGKLSEATALFLQSQLHEFRGGPELAGQLAQRLMARAQASASRQDFVLAWQDLAHADRLYDLVNRGCPPQLLRQRQELVELAVETAEAHLTAGRPLQALRVVAELKRRHILDSRADRIEAISNRVQQAECLAAQGAWSDARQAWEKVLALRPDLTWVQSRRQALAQQTATAGGLTNRLQSAMQESRWSTARQVSSQLLDIAPHLQFAADALRRSMKRQQPPLIADNSPPNESALHDTSAGKLTDTDTNLSKAAGRAKMNRSMLWVDGVGGFLLCSDPQVTIGRALPDAGIEIPVLGDLHRKHLRIARSGSDFLATPLSEVTVGGQPIPTPHLLQNNQRLTLGKTVAIEFRVPHPLSASARLNIVSRHRTQPWADAIILVADTIILGPQASSHIVCPEMEGDLLLCLGRTGWTCRYAGNIDVDGEVFSNQVELSDACRMSGDGFSMTLEPV
jgi:tetratricopeptide (TPR) repeat protein